jgi:hypothetical protein
VLKVKGLIWMCESPPYAQTDVLHEREPNRDHLGAEAGWASIFESGSTQP